MNPDALRKLVIVGGGTAGWMAAAAIARIMGGTGLEIELVESEEIGTVGVGEATIPDIVLFNAMLGIDEREFMRATNGTYKLGIEFRDWTRIGDRYVHPFGLYGIDMKGIEFHHHWLKGRTLGDTSAVADYSINIVTALAGRMEHPRRDQPNSPLAKFGYAFQFDASLYARFLRGLAETNGVVRTEGRIVDVLRDGESGDISGVRLASGATIEGDFFIDCSGFRSLLLGETLGIPFEDWTHWLPCDRALAVPCEHGGDFNPLTRSTARKAGWQWRIPLQHRIGNGHVYASAHMSDDEAASILLANLDGAPLAEPRQLRFRAGYRHKAWEKNVLALGLSGGFLEPLESTSIHLIQTGIARLMTLFPTRNVAQADRDRFNAQMTQEYHDIRDFLVLHYTATERDDSDFWRERRALELTPRLQNKVDLFRSHGRVFQDKDELFAVPSWLAVLEGQGIVPRSYHPAADLLPDDETLTRLKHIREVVASTAAALPTQWEFLRQNDMLSEAALARAS